jgi:hypothetical protein
MNDRRWVDFELPPAAIGLAVSVRLADFENRWAAVVRCGSATSNGLGASAREALVAALTPLGVRATAVLMAEPVMFAASADILSRVAM